MQSSETHKTFPTVMRTIVLGIAIVGLLALGGAWPVDRAVAQAMSTPECDSIASEIQNPDNQWAATIGCGAGGHICKEKGRLDREQWDLQCIVRCGQSWSDPNDAKFQNCDSACNSAREECPIA